MRTLNGPLGDLKRNQAGMILPLVLVFLALGLLLLTPTLGLGVTSLGGTAVTETKAMELHAADAGVEDAMHSLLGGQDATDLDFMLNNTAVSVVIRDESPYKHIESTAESPSGSKTIVDAYVEVKTQGSGELLPSPFDHAVVTLNGNLSLEDNSKIAGPVWANGNIDLEPNSKISGDATATGTVTPHDKSHVTGVYEEHSPNPAQRPEWLDKQVEEYIERTEVSEPPCGGIIKQGNWAPQKGTYPGTHVRDGNLDIDAKVTFTGPVCVDGNLEISGNATVRFNGSVKVGGYVTITSNTDVIFGATDRDTVWIKKYLRIDGNAAAQFAGPLVVNGSPAGSDNYVIYVDTNKSVEFMSTVRAESSPNPRKCKVSLGANGKYTFGDVIYSSGDLSFAANTKGLVFSEAVIAEGNLTAQGNSDLSAPVSSIPLVVSRHGDVTLTANNKSCAIIYAPEGAAKVSGNATLTGAVVAKSASLSGNNILTYPLELRDREDLHGGGEGEGVTTLTLVSYRVS